MFTKSDSSQEKSKINDDKNINKTLNKQDEWLIFGYIRKFELNYKSIVIPEELGYIVVAYYVDIAEWNIDLKYKNLIVMDNCIENKNQNDWATIFGKRILTNYGKYEWNFEILSFDGMTSNGWKTGTSYIRNIYK